jgi:hypothetical protein
MRNKRTVVCDDICEDRSKNRIVGHQVGAIGLLQLHANVLPDLHRRGTFRERLIQGLVGLLGEPGILELLRVEGGAPHGAATRAVHDFASLLILRSSHLIAAVMLIHHADIEDAQVQALQQRREGRVVFEGMRVHVDRRQGGKTRKIDDRTWAGS